MCGFVLVINGNPFFWGNSYFAPGFPAAIPAGAFPALLAAVKLLRHEARRQRIAHTINQLCRLLQCRVQDVMEYINEE